MRIRKEKMTITLDDKNSEALIRLLKLMKKIVDGLVLGNGFSYNKSEMLKLSNDLQSSITNLSE